MSETTLSKLTNEQVSALEHFQRVCQQAMRWVVLACTMLIALVLLTTNLNTQAFPLVLLVWLIMTAYPLVLIGMVRARTGLLWHSLNAHAFWIGIVFILLVLLIVLSNIVLPALQVEPIMNGDSNYDLLGLIIVLPLFAFAFNSSTRTRADLERLQYGDHWLALGPLSVHDILLFRIPHERA